MLPSSSDTSGKHGFNTGATRSSESIFRVRALGFIALPAVIVFGDGKLGSIGGALGKSIRDFRREVADRDGADAQVER